MKYLSLGIAAGVAVLALVAPGPKTVQADDDDDECDVHETDTKGVVTAYYDVAGDNCFTVSHNIKKKGQTHFTGGAELKPCKVVGGKITKARVVVSGTMNVPRWGGKAPAYDTTFINEYIDFLKTHEGKHASNLKTALDGAHKKVVGKSVDDAKALLAKLECDAAKADVALDKKEGQVDVTLVANNKCERNVSGKDRPEYLANCN